MTFQQVGNATYVDSKGDAGLFQYRGRYALALMVNGSPRFVSHDSDENRANHEPLRGISGEIVVAGLGSGEMFHVLNAAPLLTHVTIIEKSQAVIDLVWPRIQPGLLAGLLKYTVVRGDINSYNPGLIRKAACWLDHWVTCSQAEYDAYLALKARLGPRFDFIGGPMDAILANRGASKIIGSVE